MNETSVAPSQQGRRRRYGRSGHGRTTFLAENGFGRTPFSANYIFRFFLPGNFSADKILSNNIDNLSVHRSMFCLPLGVKHSRYINMILKLSPLLTTVTIIKRLSFEVRMHQCLL